MKNKSKDNSYLDEQLKQLDTDIIWDEKRKTKLHNKILFTMENDRSKNKSKLFAGFKYALNIGVLLILMFFGYNFISNSITQQSGKDLTSNESNQPNGTPIIDDKNDENQVNSEEVVENPETNMEVQTGSSETVIRIVEGSDLEVKVLNYQIEPYGIAYQLDEVFTVTEMSNNLITYSTQYDDYKITLEMIEHTNLEKTVRNLQEKFETESYDEIFELESTPVEENGLQGNIQFYGDNPVKGFIAYEIGEHALAITFQYPVEGADAMYPLLETLRKSIKVQ
ncbi:hypothetical protein ACFSFY_12675 [Sporosarcina siberiensis]|uniref:DUF4367 domain-containing protein n=1 Tax=Sporosarcina siberiensis TaxID=1365606 RepID=A0ABW4SH74_9BACL